MTPFADDHRYDVSREQWLIYGGGSVYHSWMKHS